MQRNVGDFDRVMRLAVGTALVVVGAAGYAGFLMVAIGPLPQGLTSIAAVLIGLILVVTGATRTCPMYGLLGLSTFRDSGRGPTTVEETTSEPKG